MLFICALLPIQNIYAEVDKLPSTLHVEAKLKKRQPNWLKKIISRYPSGSPEVVLFYAPEPSNGFDIPVKQIAYYLDGRAKQETDLLVLDKEDPIAKAQGTAVVSHGVSVWYDKSGNVEKIALYNKGTLDGPTRLYFSNGQLKKHIMISQGELEGPFQTYDIDGNLISEGNYHNNMPEGDWITYHTNGEKSSFIHYDNGIASGEAQEWYNNGNIKSTKHFTGGLLNGTHSHPGYLAYGENHKILEKQEFRFGQPDGVHILYFPNGIVKEKVSYIKGLKQGKEQFFSAQETILGEGNYQNGIPIGKHFKKHLNGQFSFVANYNEEGELKEPITIFDENGKKIKEYFLTNNKLDGKYTEWFPDQKIKKECSYKNGELDGVKILHNELGTITYRGSFDLGVEEGLEEEFYSNGTPAFKIFYSVGFKEGQCLSWYPNGKLKSDEHYLHNLLNGKRALYFENGQIAYQGNYSQEKKIGSHSMWNKEGILLAEASYDKDKPHGIFREYYENGTLKRMEEYSHGDLQGKSETFYANGVKSSSATFHKGKLDRAYLTWHQDGSLQKQQHWKNGIPSDEHFEFYPLQGTGEKQQLAEHLKYNKGKLHGEQCSFYSDSTKQSIISYDNGILHGPRIFWDSQGEIINESHFVHGKLEGRYYERNPIGYEIVENYKNNYLDGLHQEYYPTHKVFGKIKAIESNYLNGKIEGEVAEFNEAGTKVSSTFYVNGLKDGVATVYTKEGRIYITAEFKDDLQHGIAAEYYPDGKIRKQVLFTNDLKEGDEISYFNNGNVSSIYTYNHGLLNGSMKEWNEKGILIFEGEYCSGKKSGKFNKYYHDGQPHVLQQFLDDQPIGNKQTFELVMSEE